MFAASVCQCSLPAVHFDALVCPDVWSGLPAGWLAVDGRLAAPTAAGAGAAGPIPKAQQEA